MLKKLRRALVGVAVPEKAPAMQAYMKSEMPYYGVTSPIIKATVKPILDEHRLKTFDEWRDTALDIWRNARAREERYAALRLCEHRYYRAFHTMAALPMYEEMIVDGAWWDYVDWIAAGRIHAILQAEPDKLKKRMRKWSTDEDIWRRRTSILFQLKQKAAIDLDLLYQCIEPSLASREFFLRKAIGWALRQHAKIDDAEVIRYVTENKDRLSGLSKREAFKHIDRPIP